MDTQLNVHPVQEVKTSVIHLVKDLEELAQYVTRAKQFIEQAKIPILLDEKEASKILRVTKEELSQRRFYGKKPVFFKIGKHVRYSLLDLLEYIDSCKRHSTSQ